MSSDGLPIVDEDDFQDLWNGKFELLLLLRNRLIVGLVKVLLLGSRLLEAQLLPGEPGFPVSLPVSLPVRISLLRFVRGWVLVLAYGGSVGLLELLLQR